MIKGLGCDIVKVSRFAKGRDFLNHFMKKHLTINEIKEVQEHINDTDEQGLTLAIATRFAGKEAVSKALGSGFQDGIGLKDIEIIHDKLGCPKVTLYNKALTRAYYVVNNQQLNIHITLSNEKEYANAVAVIESL